MSEHFPTLLISLATKNKDSAQLLLKHTYIQTYTTYVYTYTCIYICMYVCTRTCTYIHTHKLYKTVETKMILLGSTITEKQ